MYKSTSRSVPPYKMELDEEGKFHGALLSKEDFASVAWCAVD